MKSRCPVSHLGATINNLAPGGMGFDLWKYKVGWISDTFEFVTKI